MESEFWEDLRENLKDPEFKEAYIKESERIQGIDMEMNKDSEDRYETVELIAKSRQDGKSWFDVIFDMITEDCHGTAYNEETGEDGDPCTCGLESMGGSGGTLQQCYDYTTTVGSKLQPIDLARVLMYLFTGNNPPANIAEVLSWAEHEIEFEEYFENREWENEEDEEDEDEDEDEESDSEEDVLQTYFDNLAIESEEDDESDSD